MEFKDQSKDIYNNLEVDPVSFIGGAITKELENSSVDSCVQIFNEIGQTK